jgi:hypothetical protein
MSTPDQRSENLLPDDDSDDGRYEIAEEVNADQQSDAARHLGQMPEGSAEDALAETLKDDKTDKQ